MRYRIGVMAVLAAAGFSGASSLATTDIGSAYAGPHARAQAALGETFVVPATDHYLTQFTMGGVAIGTPGGLPVTFHIAPWGGNAPGSDLYAASVGSVGPTYTPVLVNPGWLDLTPGGTYLAYLTTPSLGAVNSFVSSGYDGGTLVWYQTGFGWSAAGPTDQENDLVFSARFEVPEPSGLGVVSGAAGVAGLLRRRKR